MTECQYQVTTAAARLKRGRGMWTDNNNSVSKYPIRWRISLALNTINRVSLDHPQIRKMRNELSRPFLTSPGIDLQEHFN